MIVFISFLRALAAALISNAHYIGVYPTNWLSHGGMIGNILFFAVSGYCLYNVKTNFAKWYSRRFIKLYIPTFVITIAYFLVGYFKLSEEQDILYWFVYPTFYHFVSSILLLYVPFYFVMKTEWMKKHLIHIMLVVAAVFGIVYIFAFDKSYYHVDDVTKPMVRFLFFEAMLMGAWFRQNDEKFRNKKAAFPLIGVVVFCMAHFACKVALSRIPQVSPFQFVNQIVLLLLLYFVFRLFSALDGKLEKLPKPVLKAVEYVSKLTLEIYLVQHMLIEYLDLPHKFSFPVNWIVITASIIAVATVLHFVTKPMINALFKLLETNKDKTA